MSRLTIEPKANVFVGNINARVRDKLWAKVCDSWDVPALMIYSTNVEQGYNIRIHGDPSRSVFESEGISLVYLKPEKKNIEKGKEEEN
jgi:CRISPR-associated protein Cas2